MSPAMSTQPRRFHWLVGMTAVLYTLSGSVTVEAAPAFATFSNKLLTRDPVNTDLHLGPLPQISREGFRADDPAGALGNEGRGAPTELNLMDRSRDAATDLSLAPPTPEPRPPASVPLDLDLRLALGTNAPETPAGAPGKTEGTDSHLPDAEESSSAAPAEIRVTREQYSPGAMNFGQQARHPRLDQGINKPRLTFEPQDPAIALEAQSRLLAAHDQPSSHKADPLLRSAMLQRISRTLSQDPSHNRRPVRAVAYNPENNPTYYDQPIHPDTLVAGSSQIFRSNSLVSQPNVYVNAPGSSQLGSPFAREQMRMLGGTPTHLPEGQTSNSKRVIERLTELNLPSKRRRKSSEATSNSPGTNNAAGSNNMWGKFLFGQPRDSGMNPTHLSQGQPSNSKRVLQEPTQPNLARERDQTSLESTSNVPSSNRRLASDTADHLRHNLQNPRYRADVSSRRYIRPGDESFAVLNSGPTPTVSRHSPTGPNLIRQHQQTSRETTSNFPVFNGGLTPQFVQHLDSDPPNTWHRHIFNPPHFQANPWLKNIFMHQFAPNTQPHTNPGP
ncbi:hypothetical protein PtB15_15B9 [Puccinia triticina]|nr:hypothetical protein PtB15_15B9 [Puccinia triticina]